MKLMSLGKTLRGDFVIPVMDEEVVAAALAARLAENAAGLRRIGELVRHGITLRGEIPHLVVDPADPRAVGWTFLVAASDPRLEEIKAILRPLAERRGMTDPGTPLLFHGEPEEEYQNWIESYYFQPELDSKRVPHYVLMVGDPTRLPFHLQSTLSTVARVGRLDFDEMEQLSRYVNKVLRIEDAPAPVVSREVVMFGTDGGPEDPTSFSRSYMVEPLAEYVRENFGFRTTMLLGDDATKSRLAATLRQRSPALVYTASHGMVMEGQPLPIQQRYNGALCCQTAGPPTLEDLFGADDIPSDVPFLDGAVFFQFACFSAGTPQRSIQEHWLTGNSKVYAEKDFVAALPKKMLGLERGPIAMIGHMDVATLHGFADPKEPFMIDRWSKRMEPFVHTVAQLLRVMPSGLALEDMSKKLGLCNGTLADAYDLQKRDKLDMTPQRLRRLVDFWVYRNDAQNFLLLGDPAARLRIPDEAAVGQEKGANP